MGNTKKETDFWGNEKEVHYDDNNNKVGETRHRETFWGNKVQDHYDAGGEKTGSTRKEEGLFSDRAAHFDNKGNKIGTSKDDSTFFGDKIQRHYDADGKQVGKSHYEDRLFSGRRKVHEGEYFKGGSSSGTGSSSSTDGGSGGGRDVGFPWGIILVLGALMALGYFISYMHERDDTSVRSSPPSYSSPSTYTPSPPPPPPFQISRTYTAEGVTDTGDPLVETTSFPEDDRPYLGVRSPAREGPIYMFFEYTGSLPRISVQLTLKNEKDTILGARSCEPRHSQTASRFSCTVPLSLAGRLRPRQYFVHAAIWDNKLPPLAFEVVPSTEPHIGFQVRQVEQAPLQQYTNSASPSPHPMDSAAIGETATGVIRTVRIGATIVQLANGDMVEARSGSLDSSLLGQTIAVRRAATGWEVAQ